MTDLQLKEVLMKNDPSQKNLPATSVFWDTVRTWLKAFIEVEDYAREIGCPVDPETGCSVPVTTDQHCRVGAFKERMNAELKKDLEGVPEGLSDQVQEYLCGFTYDGLQGLWKSLMVN